MRPAHGQRVVHEGGAAAGSVHVQPEDAPGGWSSSTVPARIVRPGDLRLVDVGRSRRPDVGAGLRHQRVDDRVFCTLSVGSSASSSP